MRRAAAVALASVMLVSLPAHSVVADPAFTPGGPAQVRDVVDGMTLNLADGRVLRLVGIDAPLRGALAQQAKAALDQLVSGRAVDLRFAGNPRDRRGRVLAQIFAGGLWVQGELVRRGLARVRGAADNRVGVPEMLVLERQARRYHRGIWFDQAYAVLRAEDAVRSAGTFQLVRFTVAEVASGAAQTRLSASADGRGVLVLTVAAPVMKLCRDAGLDLAALKGKRVLVRGFIDGKLRPAIAITFPEQIEVLPRKK